MIVMKLLLVGVCIVSIQAWNTCNDKTFCKKLREKTAKHHFDLQLDTLQSGPSNLEVDLKNTETGQILHFKVTCLVDDVLRIQINDPSKPRHEVPEALDGEPATRNMRMRLRSDYITIETGKIRASINASPFTMNVSTDTQSITINEGGRMEFLSESDDEAIGMDFKFKGATTVYGIPERGERLSLKSTGVNGRDPYRLFNVDYFGYALETSESLYGAVPVLYAHSTEHTAGVFWLNSAQTFVDLNKDNNQVDALFISESGAIDVFIFPGPTLPDCVKQYQKLTGSAPLPPLFSIAYQQSRYSYYTQTELLEVVDKMDANDFPFDVVWLDIDYTDGMKYFTWNYKNFPRPLVMQERIADGDRKLVLVIDPHIKAEKGYFVYDEGIKLGHFVKDQSGKVFEGECWPGTSSYIDFTDPSALEWWSSLYSYEKFPNVSSNVHIWNDMNEPSVFDESIEKTLPNSVRHHGGWKHRDVHNIYGFLQSKGTHLGLLARDQNKQRPFVLSRSHFAGSQRYAAIWTGDNLSTWAHMKISIPMCLTSALAGISFCGADIGGFASTPTDDLLQRWYQLAMWLPFFRNHAGVGTKPREPYAVSAKIQNTLRRDIKTRYAHLPYWYTLWYEHGLYGHPVIRPLAYHYPKEAATLEMDWEFMVGENILVAPVLEQNAKNLNIYVPEGTWINTDKNITLKGPSNNTLSIDMEWSPAFYRAGSIVPRKDVSKKSSSDMKNDPYSLHVHLDSAKTAVGNLFVDDFDGYEYKTNKYLYVECRFGNDELSVKKIHTSATYNAAIKLDSIIIPSSDKMYTSATITSTGKKITVSYDGKNTIVSGLDIDMRYDVRVKFIK